MIYADYHATTPCLPQVISAMNEIHSDCFANPASTHYLAGRMAAAKLAQAREHIAAVLSCNEQEITYTSGATEAANTIIFGVHQRLAASRPRMLCTASEHHAILHSLQRCAAAGADIQHIAVDQHGAIDHSAFAATIDDRCSLVCIMLANNETGIIHDIPALADICHAHGALLCCDITAAMGKMDINLAALGCDFACSSAHKLYAPKGVGILWKRSGLAIDPLLYGGGQESGRRAGTENIAGIVGYGAACQWYSRNSSSHHQHLHTLTTQLETQLTSALPHLRIASSQRPRIPGCSMLTIPTLTKNWMSQLKTIAAAGSSACTSGSGSHVLSAMHYPSTDTRNSIRISLGHPTTSQDVHTIAQELINGARKLMPAHT